MQTTNFNIDLMIPNQINKDVIFNESLITIDEFLKFTIDGFIDSKDEQIEIGKKYIITGEEDKDYICYMSTSQIKKTLKPKYGMLLFSIPESSFLLYENNEWRKTQIGSLDILPNVDQNFTSINDTFEITNNKRNHCLYLNGNTTLSLAEINISEISILIKQCYNTSYNLTWPDNILWQNQSRHTMTNTPNAMDIIKLFKLAETNHFLGKVIGQNYQF